MLTCSSLGCFHMLEEVHNCVFVCHVFFELSIRALTSFGNTRERVE
jgi:hypothetical protein